jgi:hypothetical protein
MIFAAVNIRARAGRRGLLVLLFFPALASAGSGHYFMCKLHDGTKTFQDHPCGDSASFNGVMDAPRPRADDANPGWCSAHQGWLADAKAKLATAQGADARQWREKQGKEESWLKQHHCQ